LGEHLTLLQVAGLVVIILGTYLLQLHPHDHVVTPLKRIWRSPKLHLVFISLILYGFCSLMDRYILTQTALTPMQYQISVQVWFVIFHTGYFLFVRQGSYQRLGRSLRQSSWEMKLIALLTVTSRIVQSHAVAIAPAVGPVIAIKRSGSLFTTLVGGELFHDKLVFRRLFACAIMLAGIILIVRV
jgi:drug/metabolite transporter (DMT)-like permease